MTSEAVNSQIKHNVIKSVKDTVTKYGVNQGVAQYMVDGRDSIFSKRTWTKINEVMPWTVINDNPESVKGFMQVINIIEANVIRTMIAANEEHDVSRNAIAHDAVMAVASDSWKRMVINSRYQAAWVAEVEAGGTGNKVKIEKFEKEFNKQIGMQPAFAQAAFIVKEVMGVTGADDEEGVYKSTISESTMMQIINPVIDYMIEKGIIIITDTSGKKNGGIKESHTFSPDIMESAVEASMSIRGNIIKSMVSIGEMIPEVNHTQVTNPRVSMKNSQVHTYDPIGKVNTKESLQGVVDMVNKGNKVAFMIDEGHINRMNSLPKGIWDLPKES